MNQQEQQNLIDGYLQWLSTARNLTGQTIAHNRTVCESWAAFLQKQGKPSLRYAEIESVIDWITYRRSVDAVLEVTIGADLCILRIFYNYLVQFGGSTNPTGCLPEFICKSTFDRGYLSVDEVFSMLETFDTADPIQRRDRLLIALLWSTGLRTSELMDLQWRDIDLQEATLLVRRGKGRKQRQLFINDRLLEDLRHYRKQILATEKTPVFCSVLKSKSRRSVAPVRSLNSHEIIDITRSCAQKAGIPKNVTPLLLRHTFATHMFEADVPLRDIQEMMGHSHQTETAIYIHITTDAALRLLNQHIFHTRQYRNKP